MPFIGKSPTAGFASIVKDDLTPNGSTTAFTLSKQVANANDIAVFLGNVRQEPTDAYTVSGTTLTMSEAPASGLNFYVLHIAGTLESSVIPADNTISTAKIQSNAVTTAKIADNNVTSAKLPSTLDLSSKTLTIPNVSVKPMFLHATLTSLQTLTNDTLTKVALNNQAHANGMTWDTSNNRHTFTATTAGTYHVAFSIAAFSSTNTLSEIVTQIRKNNSNINYNLHLASGSGGGTVPGALRHFSGSGEIVHTFASGDYIDFWAQIQVNSGNADVHENQYGTWLIMNRIND